MNYNEEEKRKKEQQEKIASNARKVLEIININKDKESEEKDGDER